MKEFDFYEFTGVLAPGAVAVYGFARIYPELGIFDQNKEISFGEFGVLLILAYVAGHLVQSIGNFVEWILWKGAGGWPSDRARKPDGNLLAESQRARLPARIRDLLQIECPDDLTKVTAADWQSITRQIYAEVRKAGRADRIDVFNGNYGMFRGVAASLIVVLLAALCEFQVARVKLYLVLSVLILLALIRMHRFGVHYSQELFVQFIGIQSDGSAAPPIKGVVNAVPPA
jgi:hypothetical protein